jgi:hypothetical protein
VDRTGQARVKGVNDPQRFNGLIRKEGDIVQNVLNDFSHL